MDIVIQRFNEIIQKIVYNTTFTYHVLTAGSLNITILGYFACTLIGAFFDRSFEDRLKSDLDHETKN